MFTYHAIKISSKILLLSYPFVGICLQNWRLLFADILFTRETFHSNLRKTDRFSHQVTPGPLQWNKERPKIL